MRRAGESANAAAGAAADGVAMAAEKTRTSAAMLEYTMLPPLVMSSEMSSESAPHRPTRGRELNRAGEHWSRKK